MEEVVVPLWKQVRDAAWDVGYRAQQAKAVIVNPYPKGSFMHEHWQDGYDLGILHALEQERGIVAANEA